MKAGWCVFVISLTTFSQFLYAKRSIKFVQGGLSGYYLLISNPSKIRQTVDVSFTATGSMRFDDINHPNPNPLTACHETVSCDSGTHCTNTLTSRDIDPGNSLCMGLTVSGFFNNKDANGGSGVIVTIEIDQNRGHVVASAASQNPNADPYPNIFPFNINGGKPF